MKLEDIAARIDAHLKRIEANPKMNTVKGRLHRFWRTGAFASGRYVYVCYIAYQGNCHLSKADAVKYLAWLDAGNNGKHHEALQ